MLPISLQPINDVNFTIFFACMNSQNLLFEISLKFAKF